MDNGTARVIGGIYIAICKALESGDTTQAHDLLSSWSRNPDLPAEDRFVYGCIAHSASLTPDEAAAENAELDARANRPQLRLVVGGTA